MPKATFLTRMENNDPYIPLLDGETLIYEDGTQKWVYRDDNEPQFAPYEERIKLARQPDGSYVPVPGVIEMTVKTLAHIVKRNPETDEIVDEYYEVRRIVLLPQKRGGHVCTSEAPPSAPPDTVIITLVGTEVMLDLIHDRLFAEDARFGLYSEVNVEEHAP